MIEQILAFVQDPESKRVTSFADRMNFYYTTIMFSFLATFTTVTSYVGDPIDCWTPEYFTSQWIQFVDNICWMKSTYYIPFHITVEEGREQDIDMEIKYYQWIPVVFAMLALVYYIPNNFWDSVMRNTLDLNYYVDAINDDELTTDWEKRMELFANMGKTLKHYFETRKQMKRVKFSKRLTQVRYGFYECTPLFFLLGNNYGNFLTPCYLVLKIIYLILTAAVMYFFSLLVGNGWYMYGIQVASNFLAKTDWASVSSESFPKVTLCDVDIRKMASATEIHTVQCVLTINLFNEKIFTIVWFWMVFLFFGTAISLVHWMWKVLIAANRSRNLLILLKSAGAEKIGGKISSEDVYFRAFVDEFLKADGAFLFEIICSNCCESSAADLLLAVWNEFRNEYTTREEVFERLQFVNPLKSCFPGGESASGQVGPPGLFGCNSSPDEDRRSVAEIRSARSQNELKGSLIEQPSIPLEDRRRKKSGDPSRSALLARFLDECVPETCPPPPPDVTEHETSA